MIQVCLLELTSVIREKLLSLLWCHWCLLVRCRFNHVEQMGHVTLMTRELNLIECFDCDKAFLFRFNNLSIKFNRCKWHHFEGLCLKIVSQKDVFFRECFTGWNDKFMWDIVLTDEVAKVIWLERWLVYPHILAELWLLDCKFICKVWKRTGLSSFSQRVHLLGKGIFPTEDARKLQKCLVENLEGIGWVYCSFLLT